MQKNTIEIALKMYFLLKSISVLVCRRISCQYLIYSLRSLSKITLNIPLKQALIQAEIDDWLERI